MKSPHWRRQVRETACSSINQLTDRDLLSIIVGSAQAEKILEHGASLRDIVRAGRGCTKSTLAKLRATIELASRIVKEPLAQRSVLTDAEDTRKYLTLKMRDYNHEVFACLFLSGGHRLIAFEELFHGTIDGSSIYPREVVKRALYHNAAAVIFAHNHPSGQSEPSLSDRLITRTLKQALALVGVYVIDHFVVGEGITSFSEKGML